MSQTLELETPAHQGDLFPSAEPSAQASTGIERCFDVGFVAELALKEKQIQQNVRPVIAIHKWFARRPGTLFRALLLAEFAGGDLGRKFFQAHSFPGLRVADPFMGGGTPLLEANRLGIDVAGWDINPMAYWIVRQATQSLDLKAYRLAAERIRRELDCQLGAFYLTTCQCCGSPAAPVKYFLWVKTESCRGCGDLFDLLPGLVIAENQRHPNQVLVCPSCGELTESPERGAEIPCRACSRPLVASGARGKKAECPRCGTAASAPRPAEGPPRHRLLAIEYHCSECKKSHVGRFFKKPDDQDQARFQQAATLFGTRSPRFVPDDEIPAGDETDRLHRWGYRFYRQMFNDRQLLGLETLCNLIDAEPNPTVRAALATNMSDLLRYQNMLCRYDTTALKSLDIFSIHGFPVGLVQCESNLLGIRSHGGASVGSGGWSNIVDKFLRAKQYCDAPYEIRYSRRGKTIVPVPGERIGDQADPRHGIGARRVELRCESSEVAALAPSSLDAVVTDPPYFANVQYAELMDFCYVWLRRLFPAEPAFTALSTRNAGELTGNATLDRGLDHFTAGLSGVFARFAEALKPGGPFVFTYHHNKLEAYLPIAVALLDAGLVCTSSLPCPAEMGGSIHIQRTESSIVDTVFLCRSTGVVFRRQLAERPSEVAALVASDVALLQGGTVNVTLGDARCIAFGHLTRLAIWRLRRDWDTSASWSWKRNRVAEEVGLLGGWEQVKPHLDPAILGRRQPGEIRENLTAEAYDDEVPF